MNRLVESDDADARDSMRVKIFVGCGVCERACVPVCIQVPADHP